jgi:hypothetical protein
MDRERGHRRTQIQGKGFGEAGTDGRAERGREEPLMESPREEVKAYLCVFGGKTADLRAKNGQKSWIIILISAS